MSVEITDELIKSIMSGEYALQDVEEILYADNEATSTTLADVQDGTVPDGHEGMVVSIAISSDDTVLVYIKRDGKQFYENGLNCGGLGSIAEAKGTDVEGVDKEVFLGVRLKEKGKWALGLKSTSGTPTVSWRLRIRHFKKKG